jgi:hypothetical protein
MVVDRSKNSQDYANMVEHIFLADLLRHMWYARKETVEVSKAQVDSGGYDVVLSTGTTTRYVQLKTGTWAKVNERLALRGGGWVVLTQLDRDATSIQYRLWEATKHAMKKLPPAKANTYKRGTQRRHYRAGHRKVAAGLFSEPMGIKELCRALFP